jgi:hypothetical protein
MMNTKSILFVFALLLTGSISLSAQTLVSVSESITQDTLFTAIQRNGITSKIVFASGQAVFSSKSGFVRILLSDDYGYDLLVYESSSLVAVNGIDNFSSEVMETVDIPSRLALTKIRVEISDTSGVIATKLIDLLCDKQQVNMSDIISIYHKKLSASPEELYEACNGSINPHHISLLTYSNRRYAHK